MKFLVIGLGSMGKRRIRCLKALGFTDITGFDVREDRRREAEATYGVGTLDDEGKMDAFDADAFLVSTPPDMHLKYIRQAIEKKKPVFVEASVILNGLAEMNELAKRNDTVVAPSCTLRFHPAIKDIKAIVNSGRYGKVTNFSYHSGQYLPDWHPWEDVGDFYVSKKETGGCREIVPFELTWLVDVVGWPEDVKGYHGRTMDVRAEIDDTYAVAMRLKNGYGNILVDVVSRYAVRTLVLNMERAQICWNWDEPVVKLFEAESGRWVEFHQQKSESAQGYNKNIIEAMYIEEIDAFLRAAKGERDFPNRLEEDIRILTLLKKIEES